MRTAAICPTCATYENAKCIIYNGPILTNINVNPLEDLETILGKINNNFVPLSGTTTPSTSATYLGQTYLNTTTKIQDLIVNKDGSVNITFQNGVRLDSSIPMLTSFSVGINIPLQFKVRKKTIN